MLNKKNIIYILLFLSTTLGYSCSSDLVTYSDQLSDLREKCMSYSIGSPRFFLFGMGNRDKYLYKDYQLINIENDSVILSFTDVLSDTIRPSDYRVDIYTKHGKVSIVEDEEGIWMEECNRRDSLHTISCNVKLPSFEDKRYGKILKVLHQEILFNIMDSRLYPNIFVYKKPFLRDAFMGGMCLELTGNIGLLKPWINSIDSVYDMQNHEKESDNLGELLYLLSFIPSDSNIVLRQNLGDEIKYQTIYGDNCKYLNGHTDGNNNAEYQTQILKYALQKNGLKDDYTEAPELGFYYNLCWFTKGSNNHRTWRQMYDNWVKGDRDLAWPYLMWARSHYYNDFNAPWADHDYPLSWEQGGTSAFFEGMHVLSEKAVEDKICYPHVWTAAEMFLKLYEYEKKNMQD